MKRFLILIVLSVILPSILYSQNDSLRCFTVKQQNEIIAKLVHEIELTKENKILSELLLSKDSTIADKDGIIEATKDKYEATKIIYTQEKESRLEAEKEATKYKRRTKFWKGATFVSLGAGLIVYIFK